MKGVFDLLIMIDFFSFRMRRKYIRQHSVARGQWTEEKLKQAIEKV